MEVAFTFTRLPLLVERRADEGTPTFSLGSSWALAGQDGLEAVENQRPAEEKKEPFRMISSANHSGLSKGFGVRQRPENHAMSLSHAGNIFSPGGHLTFLSVIDETWGIVNTYVFPGNNPPPGEMVWRDNSLCRIILVVVPSRLSSSSPALGICFPLVSIVAIGPAKGGDVERPVSDNFFKIRTKAPWRTSTTGGIL